MTQGARRSKQRGPILARQPRTKPSNTAPVTSHPLFSAVVALWFGALFGLGSLAVRGSLIETAVLALHLDIILPSAAPPLGVTARMIVALVMAAIGIATGTIIARRISRPKPVKRERRRGAAAIFGERQERPRQTSGNGRASYAAQAIDRDIAGSYASPRRRSLALEEQECPDYQFDAAPVPGAAPLILDVTQFDLSAPGDDPTGPDRPLDRLDLPDSGRRGQEASSCVFDSPIAHGPEARENAAEHRAPGADGVPASVVAQSDGTLAAADFTDTRAISFAPQERSGIAANEFLDAAADFARPESAPAASRDVREEQASEDAAPTVAEQPPVYSEQAPAAPQRCAIGVATPQASAAERIALADLAELSPVELTERLALALQQRRHRGAAPAVLAEAAAALAACAPAQLPEAPNGHAQFAALPPLAALQRIVAADRQAASVAPAAPLASLSSSADAVAAPTLRLSLPEALRPIDFGENEDSDTADDFAVPPRSIGLPSPAAAVPENPCGSDDDVLTLDVEQIADAIHYPDPDVAEIDDEVKEDAYSSLLDIARPAPPRQNFVRIDEPEADPAEIEPVVIFPGHEARVGTRFAKPSRVAPGEAPSPAPAPIAEDGTPQLRRFDAPAAVAPVGTPGPAAGQVPDAAETERALRGALATLQRMSGAA